MEQLKLFNHFIPEIQISVKVKGAKSSELTQITSSEDVYAILKLCFNQYKIN